MTTPTEREVLEALWNCPTCSGDCGSANPPPIFCPTDRFRKMLDCGAYESAALMLVEPGSILEFDLVPDGPSAVRFAGNEVWYHGATPALALCAAIEAAIARAGE